MYRRVFLLTGLSASMVLWPTMATAANRKCVFKIKTKSGGIIGNIVIEAKDIEAAKRTLRERYPNCEIPEGKEK